MDQDEAPSAYLLKGLKSAEELDADFGRAVNITLFGWLRIRSGDVAEPLSWIGWSRSELSIWPWYGRLLDKVLAELPDEMSEVEIKELLSKGDELNISEVVTRILDENSEQLAESIPVD
jgi:hypothetical protein